MRSLHVIRWVRNSALASFAMALCALPAHAQTQAQNYPTQPLKIIVPFAPGGGVDVVARIILPKLTEELGQSIVIDNRGGAGGAIGAAALVQSAPDGYTLLLGTGSTHGTNSSVYSKLSYDPVRDFAPVALVSTSPLLMIVNPSLPVQSVADFISLARSRPGELSFGSYGTGSINHLAAELFNSMADIKANHVPYRGSAPALIDLMAGRLNYSFDGVTTSLGHIAEGKVRLMGVTGLDRSPVLPGRPTISESGLPGFETMVWFGLFAPAATPKWIINHLNSKVRATLAAESVKKAFEKLGVEVVGGGPEVLAAKVNSEMQKWSKLVREKNIRIDP